MKRGDIVSGKVIPAFCRMFGHRWRVSPGQERWPVIAGVTHTRETACLRCPATFVEPHYGMPGIPPEEGP
jgi:hypothetical protein